jgi:hypothetical protein
VNTYFRALVRFWWLPVLGIAVAAVAAISVVNKITPGAPPKLTPRATPTYTATTEAIVASTTKSYFKTKETITTAPVKTYQLQSYIDPVTGKHVTKRVPLTQPAQKRRVDPNTDALVKAANLFPLYIQSDAVTRLRLKMFPTLPVNAGTVTAKTVGSVSTNTKSKASYIPAVQITATAKSEKGALDLAQATYQAFERWLTLESKGVPVRDRILVDQLNVPFKAAKSGGPSYPLAAFVGIAVLFAFVIMTGMLDQAFPRRRRIERLDRIDDGTVAADDGSERPTFAFAARARDASGSGSDDDRS